MEQTLKADRSNRAVAELLQSRDPSIRYLVMRELLGYSEKAPGVVEAKSEIINSPLVSSLLADQSPQGYWAFEEDVYWPKWRASVWPLILLGEFGAPGNNPRIERACEYFLKTMDGQDRSWPMPDYAESDLRGYRSVWEPCVTGNMARTMVVLGKKDDPRVREMFKWLVMTQWKDGGWNCEEGDRSKVINHSSFMSTIEPLWAFSSLPRSDWPKGGRETVDRGCEFLLMHRLYKSDRTFQVINEEWMKLHYPMFYFYDILHALRVLTALDHLDDKRTNDALGLLRSKQLEDGTWPLEASYVRSLKRNLVKDTETGEWIRVRAEDTAQVPPVYDLLGSVGERNEWITLNALRVLSRLEEG